MSLIYTRQEKCHEIWLIKQLASIHTGTEKHQIPERTTYQSIGYGGNTNAIKILFGGGKWKKPLPPSQS